MSRRCSGRVAGAVRLHALRGAAAAPVLEAAADVPVHQLRRLARRREGDHARSGEHALRGDVARLRERAAAHAGGGVLQRRVPEHDRALRARRLVLVDHGERRADEAFGELLRIADRRRGEHEARVRAVLAAEAPQPAHDLGDVAAEDAAVDVRLVEDHVPQLVQVLGPALVPGQDADVQHVGVAEQDGRGAAQQRPLVLRRVPVVDGRHHAGHAEPVELACLVLGERLGGEEEEGARLGVGDEGLEHGELVAEALAARRPGAHDHVLAGRQEVPGGGLVTVERAGRRPRGALRAARPAGLRGGRRRGRDAPPRAPRRPPGRARRP